MSGGEGRAGWRGSTGGASGKEGPWTRCCNGRVRQREMGLYRSADGVVHMMSKVGLRRYANQSSSTHPRVRCLGMHSAVVLCCVVNEISLFPVRSLRPAM